MHGYRACTRVAERDDTAERVTTNLQLQHLATCWRLPAFPSLPVAGLNRVTRGTSNSGRDGAGGFSLMSLTLRPLWQLTVLTAPKRTNVWSLSAWVEGASAGPMTVSRP